MGNQIINFARWCIKEGCDPSRDWDMDKLYSDYLTEQNKNKKYYQIYFEATTVCAPSGEVLKSPVVSIVRALTDESPEDFIKEMQLSTYKIVYLLLDGIELNEEEFKQRKNKGQSYYSRPPIRAGQGA